MAYLRPITIYIKSLVSCLIPVVMGLGWERTNSATGSQLLYPWWGSHADQPVGAVHPELKLSKAHIGVETSFGPTCFGSEVCSSAM
jgi:hypothetical protein